MNHEIINMNIGVSPHAVLFKTRIISFHMILFSVTYQCFATKERHPTVQYERVLDYLVSFSILGSQSDICIAFGYQTGNSSLDFGNSPQVIYKTWLTENIVCFSGFSVVM